MGQTLASPKKYYKAWHTGRTEFGNSAAISPPKCLLPDNNFCYISIRGDPNRVYATKTEKNPRNNCVNVWFFTTGKCGAGDIELVCENEDIDSPCLVRLASSFSSEVIVHPKTKIVIPVPTLKPLKIDIWTDKILSTCIISIFIR